MAGTVFLGTSAFAVPSLEALAEGGERILSVVTQPDRPKGRGRHPEPSPVKSAAERLGLDLLQPETINDAEALTALQRLAPDLLVVVAYGQILRRAVLDLPRLGAVNLHASLLPRHRGPSPIVWAILEGDGEVGNTTMLMEEGLDSGPILLQEVLPLPAEATRGDLEAVLSSRGARLLRATVEGLRQHRVAPQPQDASLATWSRLITREMRPIEWDRPAAEIRRRIHALSPTPAALARVEGRLLKILRVVEVPADGPPGRVLAVGRDGPVVGCGHGALVLREVQPEGKRPMSGADFCRGGGLRPGSVLESAADG